MSTATSRNHLASEVELSDEESRTLFNDAAERYLGMSGREFIERYDAGEFQGHHGSSFVHVEMLLPFGRV